MLDQAFDFREECDAVFDLIGTAKDDAWATRTQFKEWTFNDIIAHLHMGNYAADLALRDTPAFREFAQKFSEGSREHGHLHFTHVWLNGEKNAALLQRWHNYASDMAERFASANPRQRVEWFGPTMSVRSSITARLMETWAHAHAIYDVLGKERKESDKIKNIVVMGLNTFGWTFTNLGDDVPENVPYLRLTAPSGEVWEWGTPDSPNRIEGAAVEFCQTVTQVRNVLDTKLTISGNIAKRWMQIAQCFAGPVSNPPAAGTRFRHR